MTGNVARVLMIGTALMGTAALAQSNDAGSQGNTSTYQPVHKTSTYQPVHKTVVVQTL